jgi:copper homeostasis protein
MGGSRIIEISVETAEAAMAAERGGAHRIELCSNARDGGTTPSVELMRATRERLQITIFAMIRPRGGNFAYCADEFETMERQIETAKTLGMEGFVLGLMDAQKQVDVERTRHLVEAARPLPVTYHRAFDECVDLQKSLEDVIETGAERLLTSGGRPTATEALETLSDLVQLAGTRIIVMPGSGIHAGNIGETVEITHAKEFHAGLSSVVARPAENLGAFEDSVRKLANALAACG